MMLEITKCIVYSSIKYLRAAETNQLQAKLRTYESNAFGRSMGSCLRLSSTSFVGRDFKIMSQQLPAIINGPLRREWSTLANDRKKVIEIWYNCFVAHGELVSLVYTGQISDDFGEYCRIVHQKVDELTAAIVELEAVCARYHIAGSRVVSKTSKLHVLHHLRDDLVRFAPAIHFESEKGEQFNKFIRERIFHTNRHNSSRDVLTLFGRQFMFLHIIDGGFWQDKDDRVNAGDAIHQYMETHPDFGSVYLGADREYSDNNTSVKEFKKGAVGFFLDLRDHVQSTIILGQIADIVHNEQDGTPYVHLNVFAPFRELAPQTPECSFPYSIYSNCVNDTSGGNLIVAPWPIPTHPFAADSLHLDDLVDLQPYDLQNGYSVVNVSKFGTLWYLLQNNVRALYAQSMIKFIYVHFYFFITPPHFIYQINN
ncbi:hypothetical protein BJV82DRAFT_575007 [Fennellomyces sp. T-0311]|nr:hypothetical protein BJV82DRAFT_575007 [Fennellomyces sp. T-0311]